MSFRCGMKWTFSPSCRPWLACLSRRDKGKQGNRSKDFGGITHHFKISLYLWMLPGRDYSPPWLPNRTGFLWSFQVPLCCNWLSHSYISPVINKTFCKPVLLRFFLKKHSLIILAPPSEGKVRSRHVVSAADGWNRTGYPFPSHLQSPAQLSGGLMLLSLWANGLCGPWAKSKISSGWKCWSRGVGGRWAGSVGMGFWVYLPLPPPVAASPGPQLKQLGKSCPTEGGGGERPRQPWNPIPLKLSNNAHVEEKSCFEFRGSALV